MVIWSGFSSNFNPRFIQKKYYVYAISLTEYGTPIYIGKGSGNRVKHHARKNSKTAISKILNKRTDYWISILSDSNDEDVIFHMEEYYIKRYGKKIDGGVLVNVEDGGRNSGTVYKYVEFRQNRSLEYSKKFGKSCHFAGFIFPSKRVAFNAMNRDRQSSKYYKSIGYYFEIDEDWNIHESFYQQRLEDESAIYQQKISSYSKLKSGKRRPVMFKGKVYDSITSAALENGKTPPAIVWWLNNPNSEDCFYMEGS